MNLNPVTDERERGQPLKAYGFRTFNALETAPYHALGDLPKPNFTHEFF